jgi:hypothetical protein
MRIKIWAAVEPRYPNAGPYQSRDTIERETQYSVGELTHYGPVIAIAPSVLDEDVDQNVIVKLDPTSLGARPPESVLENPHPRMTRSNCSPF